MERQWRSLTGSARAMMSHACLPRHLWTAAFACDVHIRNRVISRGAGSDGGIPHQLLYGEYPDVSHLRVLGCAAKDKQQKLCPKATRHVLSAGRVIVFVHVVFNETEFPCKTDASASALDLFSELLQDVGLPDSADPAFVSGSRFSPLATLEDTHDISQSVDDDAAPSAGEDEPHEPLLSPIPVPASTPYQLRSRGHAVS
eukprot:scaffold73237_cov14-Prasinocladus_malaysianus.AAC.4